jgi:hypothetical protein
MKKVLLVLVSLFGLLYGQSSADLKIADTTASVSVEYDLPFNPSYYLKAGYIYKDEVGRDNFSHIGFLAKNVLKQYENHTFIAGVNIDLVFSTGDYTYIAIPIGFEVIDEFRLESFDFPFFLKANLSYATKVLSLEDANNFTAYSFEAGANFIENVKAYIGYRDMRFNSNNSFDNSIYLGVGFIF